MNNEAPELSPEARRLISAARGADDPTADDQARVKARWLASVAAVAGVSSLTEAARAAGGIGWGLKAAGAALVVAAGAIGLNFALDADRAGDTKKATPSLPGWESTSHERFQKTPRDRGVNEAPAHATPNPGAAEPPHPAPAPVAAPTLEPPTPVAPIAEPQLAQPVEAPAVAVTDEAPTLAPAVAPEASGPARSVARTRPGARALATRASAPRTAEKTGVEAAPSGVEAPAPAEASGQLGEELALLSEVRSSVQEGAGTRALELLSRYESRFGQPILGMEADALRVDALCKAGQREAARESARAFQNEWPGSPLERRVSAACP